MALLVAAVFLAAATAFALTSQQDRAYGAAATLVVGPTAGPVRSDVDALLGARRLAITYASLARSELVLMAAIDRLALPLSAEELSHQVTVRAPGETSLVVIRAEGPDATLTAEIANAVADATLASQSSLWRPWGTAQAIDGDLAFLRSQIAAVRSQLDRRAMFGNLTAPQGGHVPTLRDRLERLTATYADLLPMSSADSPTVLTMLERAVPPMTPLATGPLVNGMIAGLLAMSAGLLIVMEPVGTGVSRPEWLRRQVR